jgi:Transglutaminase-like superfamily
MWGHRYNAEASDGPCRMRLRDLRARDAMVIAETLSLLPAVQLAVRIAGLEGTTGWVRRLSGIRLREAPPISNAWEIERIAQLIRGTCRRWPFRATCLDRSLVTIAILGRRGVPVTICVGFRKRKADTEGHAWVEHNTRPLAEAADVTAMSRIVFDSRD